MRDIADLSAELLEWYDANAREMPWRTAPHARKNGVMPDPYHIWMSEIMLQQTTVAAVKEYFLKFTRLWPTVQDLANAADEDVMAAWAGLGYYARARNLLKCARVVVADHGGTFPNDHAALLKLPGIGPYTAAAVSSIAFDQAQAVLDGNVERVMSRLYRVDTPLPAAKPELMDLASALTPDLRPGDYAQAVMDLGATICTPKSPACGICPWMKHCDGRKAGDQADYPKKTPKKPKPTRHGIAYVGQREDGAFLLERRPEKGLLGGMLGWPGAEWGDVAQEAPPADTNWTPLNEDVRHTFTHFHLILQIRVAQLPMDCPGLFIAKQDFSPSDLPTVMRKCFNLAKTYMSH
ncbi:A/G-specific adenine glycosylase [Halocynthiibacter styelae]|uniref:Adenine DNA glycosylase n=1 Tax=Halocynthiibacter styelae TaxID=2761955 RepID=A0A8J7IK92_9RHOB|nr:A/G-specific adenine glycosylase [Paenihalocynthiibacter styelae]MBI1494768.1 A/G-specific adenine glycosylase [Paenihalocynthiibacter styelae]